MNLREYAAIAGKPGLYKILKPSRAGVIVESLDPQKTRFVATATSKVSLLQEITIYTTEGEGSTPLIEVMAAMSEKYGADLPVTSKSDGNELHGMFAEVLPEYDRERVYTSDIKKIVTWYTVLQQYAPEAFTAVDEEPSADESNDASNEEDKGETKA